MQKIVAKAEAEVSYSTLGKVSLAITMPSLQYSSSGSQKATMARSPSRSYILQLHEDLIIEIFKLALLDLTLKEVNIPIQYVLCTVCRSWRELILHTPVLWTDIHIPTSAPFDNFIFFERSSPALIDVTFSSVSTWASAVMHLHARVSDLISKHIHRLRSLTICILSPQELAPLLQSWKQQDAPNFQHLSIDTLAGHPAHEVVLSQPNVNALRYLNLYEFDFYGFPSLPCLTNLEVSRMSPTPRQMRTLFTSCPILDTLVIRRMGSPEKSRDDPTEMSQVDAPFLRSLAFNLDSDHDNTCNCAFPYLSTPNLEYLEISYLWATVTEHHSAILSLSKNLPRLQRLRMQSISLWQHDLSFLSCLPSTTNLEIIGFSKADSPTLILILKHSNLKSITIDLSSRKRPKHWLDLPTLHEVFSTLTPTLRCPTVLCIKDEDELVVKLKQLLGEHFSYQMTPTQPGLLYDFLERQRFDDDEDFLERLMGGSQDDEFEDYLEGDFDDYYDEPEFDFEEVEDDYFLNDED